MSAHKLAERPEPSSWTTAFRDAMRQLPGGVSVITVGRGEERSGLTVTSVSSLSLDPPTLIVCVYKQSSSWPLLLKHKAFGVNVLRADQQAVAERFAGRGGLRGPARFGDEPWITLATGVPLLAAALARIDCGVEETIDRHSHAIVIGRVEAVQVTSSGEALVYWHGQYVSSARDAPVAQV